TLPEKRCRCGAEARGEGVPCHASGGLDLPAMKQIDLDDLPPRIAQALASIAPGEELVLVRGGLVVARLTGLRTSATEPAEIQDDLSPEERMEEVLSQFNAAIHDEF